MTIPGPDYPAPTPAPISATVPVVPQPPAPVDDTVPAPAEPTRPVPSEPVTVELPDLRRLFTPGLAAAATYLAAFLVALAVSGLLLGKAPSDLNLPGGALGKLASFLTSMAFGGSLQASASASSIASGQVHLAVIPWGITGLAGVAGVWVVRLRNAPAATTVRARWADIVLTGAILGALGAIVAAVAKVTWTTTVVFMDASATVSASAGGVLIGGFLLGALTAFIGHAWANRSLASVGLRVPPVLTDAFRALVIGIGIPSVVAGLALAVFELVKLGFGVGLAVVLMTLPVQVVWANALGVFGSGHLSGVNAGTASIAHTGSWAWLTLLLSVVALVLTARVRWSRAGRIRPWHEAWAIPVLAGVGGLLAVLLAGMSASWSGSALSSEDVGSGSSLRLSGALIVLAMLWGAIAEVLERYAGPYLVAYIPALHLAGRPTGSHADIQQGAGYPVGAGVPTVRAIKVSRGVGWSIAGVLAFAIIVIIGRAVVASTVFTPQAPVTAYINDLNAGHVKAAFKIADPDVPNAQRGLLTDEAYAKVQNKPTGMHVTKVTKYAGGASVTVEGKQDGQNMTETFTVAAEGSKDVLFTNWVVKNAPVNQLKASGLYSPDGNGTDTFVVNGVSFNAKDPIYVLPGTYTLARGPVPGADGILESTTSSYTVRAADPVVDLSQTSEGSSLQYELTAHGKDLAVAYAKDQVAKCMASTSLNSPGCGIGYGSYWYSDSDVSNVQWQLVGNPTYDVQYTGAIEVKVTGQASVTYDVTDSWSGTTSSQHNTKDLDDTWYLQVANGALTPQQGGE